MKKLLSLILTLAVAVSSFGMFACSSEGPAAKTQYSVTLDSNNGGTLTADVTKVDVNGSVTFTFEPQAGYILKDFYLNGTSVASVDEAFTLGQTTYTLNNVLRNYTARAEYVKATGTLDFVGEGTENIENKPVAYGAAYGELPIAYAAGKKFVGWKDASGRSVTDKTITEIGGTIQLAPEFVDLTEDEIVKLAPFTSTVAFYDASATKYGVAWHTGCEPVQPMIQVVAGTVDTSLEGEDADAAFANASTYATTYKEYIPVEGFDNYEYIVYAVLDDLEFATDYSVRFGDASADTWSKIHNFTTREENVESTSFFFITDTQQRWHVGDPSINNAYGDSVETTHWYQVMRHATEMFPDAQFVLHGGDIFDRADYPTSYAAEMLSTMEDWLFQIPTMVVAGNHEDPAVGDGLGYDCVSALYNVDYPDRNTVNTEEYLKRGPVYSFDYGPVHFTMLRSNDIFYWTEYEVLGQTVPARGVLSPAQVDWIKKDLAEAEADGKWNIVVMHESTMRSGQWNSSFSGSANYATLADQLVPLFNECGVDLVLFGHDHTLYASYPMLWDESIAEPEDQSWRVSGNLVANAVSPNSVRDKDPNTTEDEELARYIALRKSRPATTEVQKVLYNDVYLDDFVYPQDYQGDTGVVWYQISCSGNQTSANEANAHGDFYSGEAGYTVKLDPFAMQMLRTEPINGGGRYSANAYSMYSYIEVTADNIYVRTYGVRARRTVKYPDMNLVGTVCPDDNEPFAKYIDGFVLDKAE